MALSYGAQRKIMSYSCINVIIKLYLFDQEFKMKFQLLFELNNKIYKLMF